MVWFGLAREGGRGSRNEGVKREEGVKERGCVEGVKERGSEGVRE